MIAGVLTLCGFLLGVAAVPVSQPVYSGNGQYYTQQQYLQQVQSQPQYISAPPIPQGPTPIYEGAPQHQVQQQQQYAQNPPTQRVAQLLLPSAADRQVQKAAEQLAGPQYAQQVQIAQQQGLANEALVVAQRRAQAQLRRAQQQAQAQQAQQAQQAHESAQQQQYLSEVSPKQQYIQVQVPQHLAQQQYQLEYEQEYEQPTAKPLRAIPQNYRVRQQEHVKQQPEEEHDNNSSYQFGFDVKDDHYTNYQNRKEQREGGKISGSYSVVDSDGFIRTVTYTADPKEGFKAEVVRKPTDIVVKVPQPKEQQAAQEPHQQYIQEIPVSRYQQPAYHHQQQQQQQQQQHQPQQQHQHQQHQQQQKVIYQYQ